MADGPIQFGREVFAEALGKDYDLSDLVQWLKTDGRVCLDETTDLLFAEGVAKGSDAWKKLQNELASGLERRGLKLRAGGEWLKGQRATTGRAGLRGKTGGSESKERW